MTISKPTNTLSRQGKLRHNKQKQSTIKQQVLQDSQDPYFVVLILIIVDYLNPEGRAFAAPKSPFLCPLVSWTKEIYFFYCCGTLFTGYLSGVLLATTYEFDPDIQINVSLRDSVGFSKFKLLWIRRNKYYKNANSFALFEFWFENC